LKRSKRAALLAGLLLLLGAADPARAQTPAPWALGASRAEDLVVRLVTIAPSDPIYTWWGHSALIVEDARLGISRFYNYGLFSFEQERFVLNFTMGRLWFQVGASDTGRELAYYRRLGRRIRIQTLDLLPGKRLEMARFLENNILPRNRTYLYDHYYDNCATRIRDLIDATVDGQLAEAAALPGRMTLREHTRRYTGGSFFMDWLLMFLMSDVIDRPITKWEEMFLPDEVQRNVATLRYTDETGAERSLVGESFLYFDAPRQQPVPDRARPLWFRALIPGLILGLPAVLLGILIRRGSTNGGKKRMNGKNRSRNTGWTLFGIYSAAAGLILGLPGSALFFMSTFTDHTVTYGNENLFLTNPLALAAIPLGIVAAFGRSKKARRLLQLFWFLPAGSACVYLLLRIFPFFDQQNGPALATILPVLFAFSAADVLSWKRA
jgi:hypothetical protein